MPDWKEKYDSLKKRYSLPDYEEMNREFYIEEIDTEDLVLQKIRLKMHEKLHVFADLIESMIQPESSLADMYEAHYVDDKDKNSAYMVFKRLMRLIRYSNLVSIGNGEEENAKFIREAYKEYATHKKSIESHIKRLLELWGKETDIKEDLNYFG